jgi:hypothetical protein
MAHDNIAFQERFRFHIGLHLFAFSFFVVTVPVMGVNSQTKLEHENPLHPYALHLQKLAMARSRHFPWWHKAILSTSCWKRRRENAIMRSCFWGS